ncbi:type-F conjugative transfer system pilin assembly protein TrbC [Tepidimonas charontis]|uniref:type-F conjugative transfer system pilin assembly protein TrbC n=1 Tax=Tepidimonas charontis TaxID=2267262 RepID=UPI0013756F01|nr:type-F conjugative transfer system pilin assembly protein TrbC [Tepidimonas charontis]
MAFSSASVATVAHLSKPQAPTAAQPDLLVLVSLSMPKQALERIIEQAERAGATLVFRGLKDGSMNRMGEELQKLIGQRNVSAAIHPPAFQQFSVTRVPAVVIAGAEAGEVLENGCARPETFVKVTGDVTLDYALDYIERKSPAWAAWAKHYRSKIVGGIR